MGGNLETEAMSLEESCLKVVGILTQYDLVTEKLSEEEIDQYINELKANRCDLRIVIRDISLIRSIKL